MTHPVVHFELGGPDGRELARFYEELFGWTVQDAGPEYWLVDPGGGSLAGGVLQTSGEMPASYVTLYVAVDDLEAAMAEAAALGAALMTPPQQIPGFGVFAMFQDPAGNTIGMMQQDVG